MASSLIGCIGSQLILNRIKVMYTVHRYEGPFNNMLSPRIIRSSRSKYQRCCRVLVVCIMPRFRITQQLMPVAARPSFPFARVSKFLLYYMVRYIHGSETSQITLPPQASLHFCSECNNLLYPKAEQQRRTMVYACRICPNVDETVDSGLVYRNDLLNITK